MILLVNNQKSLYYSENYKALIDGFGKQLQDAIKTGNIVDPSNLPKAQVRHSVYKDNNIIYISAPLGGVRYAFEIKEPISWKICNDEIQEISGYKCIKAITKINNRMYIAWFTYDIPISDGPYKFNGLPGLILKLNEEHHYFNFELLSLKKVMLPIEFNKEKQIIVSREQYLSKRKEYLKDPSQGKINTPQYRQYIEENRKKNNNFLEN